MKTLLTLVLFLSVNLASAMIYDYLPGEELTLYELNGILKIQGDVENTSQSRTKEFIVLKNIREVFNNHLIAQGTDLTSLCQNIGYEDYFNNKYTYEKSDALSLKLKKLPEANPSFFKLKFLKRHSRVVYQLTCWRFR